MCQKVFHKQRTLTPPVRICDADNQTVLVAANIKHHDKTGSETGISAGFSGGSQIFEDSRINGELQPRPKQDEQEGATKNLCFWRFGSYC